MSQRIFTFRGALLGERPRRTVRTMAARPRFKTMWWQASAVIGVVLMLFLLPRPEANPTGDPDGDAHIS